MWFYTLHVYNSLIVFAVLQSTYLAVVQISFQALSLQGIQKSGVVLMEILESERI